MFLHLPAQQQKQVESGFLSLLLWLTHLPLDKMDAISQTIFSFAFSWKIKISLQSVPKGPNDNIIGSDNGFVPTRRQANIGTYDG